MTQYKTIVTFGEIMMRLSTPGFQRIQQATRFNINVGGGEANVAVSLANFGMPTQFVTRVPDNEIGYYALQTLRKFNVGTDYIVKGGERLGLYFLETGAVQRASKVVYDRSNSSIATMKPGTIDWKAVLKNAGWFHWTGITPALSQDTADTCKEAIQTANRMGITVSCDLNFRKNLWKYGKKAGDVMPGLVEGCDIILGNEEDAETVFGIKPEGYDVTKGHADADQFQSVCEQLMKKFPRTKKTIITLRGSISASHNTWSGVLYDGHTLFKAPTYQLTHIVDRVGGGDSFMGGLIYGLSEFSGDDQKALNFAVAASCLKHTIEGDFNLATTDEVMKLMRGDSSGRVSR